MRKLPWAAHPFPHSTVRLIVSPSLYGLPATSAPGDYVPVYPQLGITAANPVFLYWPYPLVKLIP